MGGCVFYSIETLQNTTTTLVNCIDPLMTYDIHQTDRVYLYTNKFVLSSAAHIN